MRTYSIDLPVTVLDCRVVVGGFLILIHIVHLIFNSLLLVFDGKSQNNEKELS